MPGSFNTRREKLDDKGKERVDFIREEMIKEVEERVPKPRATLDMRPDKVRKEIFEKYQRMWDEVFREYGV